MAYPLMKWRWPFFIALLTGLIVSCRPITPMPGSDIPSTVMALSRPHTGGVYPSPDGQWRAEVIVYDCVQTGENGQNAFEELRLVRASGNVTSTIATQLRNCGGLGAFGLAGLFWAPNNQNFYYTDAREGTPDGCGAWAGSIIRYTLATKQTEKLGGGPRSPDGEKIATWQGQEIVVWDINTGEIARRPAVMPELMPGPLVWSPDSQALIYLQMTTPCPLSGQSYAVRLDLPALEQTVLFASERPTFYAATWVTPDYITLLDENRKPWRYDFIRQQLTPEKANVD
ncbi:MAG: hypothetical protein NT075_25565 [Chloroflexi bacterium]|nr:hypothetical protein [Chloroflexota bacterium]